MMDPCFLFEGTHQKDKMSLVDARHVSIGNQSWVPVAYGKKNYTLTLCQYSTSLIFPLVMF
jgi:hypothetical protein